MYASKITKNSAAMRPHLESLDQLIAPTLCR